MQELKAKSLKKRKKLKEKRYFDIMIDQDFYSHLEFQLTKAFPNSDDNLITSFWCDGILPVSEEESSNIHKIELRTTAFIGVDGQEKYEMTIVFGPKALSNYSQGFDLKSCIPDRLESGWIDVDSVNKKILIRLL